MPWLRLTEVIAQVPRAVDAVFRRTSASLFPMENTPCLLRVMAAGEERFISIASCRQRPKRIRPSESERGERRIQVRQANLLIPQLFRDEQVPALFRPSSSPSPSFYIKVITRLSTHLETIKTRHDNRRRLDCRQDHYGASLSSTETV